MPPFVIKSAADYGRSLRGAVRGLWSGTWDITQFVDGLLASVEQGLHRAWYDGAAECDIKPDELTLEELSRLQEEINNDLLYVMNFAAAIVNNSKLNGGKLGPLLSRTVYWNDRYQQVRDIAKTMACADQKYQWVLNPAEHCTSCLKLDGKVKRGSTWSAANVYPKNWDLLVCGGGCKCDLTPTDLPLSPGPLPVLP